METEPKEETKPEESAEPKPTAERVTQPALVVLSTEDEAVGVCNLEGECA